MLLRNRNRYFREGCEGGHGQRVRIPHVQFQRHPEATETETDAIGTGCHRCLNNFLHRTAEGDAALKLEGDVFSDELSNEVGTADFIHLEGDVGFFTAGDFGNFHA